MNAATYVRTSQDSDDAFSLSSQLKEVMTYAKESNIPVSYTFQEEYTGKVLDRPELNKLRALYRKGVIDTVIVFDATRLARKVGVAEYILDEVFELGIELHLVSWGTCVKNTTRDIKTFYDEAVYAHIERMKIIERLARGKKDKLSQGKWMCQGIDRYGFITVGKKKNQHLEIVAHEAEVISAIFKMYTSGKSVSYIAEGLQKAGYDTPSVAKGSWTHRSTWSVSMVYTILRDEAYTGIFYANRTQQVMTDKGTRSQVLRDKSEWIPMIFPDLRIVSDELFKLAQDMLTEGQHNFATKNEYLMNRRIKCGDCKYMMGSSTSITRGNPYSYYCCNSRNTKDHACRLSIRTHVVEDIVTMFVKELLDHPEKVLKELQDKQRLQIQENAITLQNIDTAKRVVARYEQELKDYAELYTQRLITLHIFAEKKADLDKRVNAAKDIVAEYEAAIHNKVLSNGEIKHKVKEVMAYRAELMKNGELSYTSIKHAVNTLNIHAVVGRHDNRVYVGIVWDGATCAYYADNCSEAVAINSTHLTVIKHPCIWLYYPADHICRKYAPCQSRLV